MITDEIRHKAWDVFTGCKSTFISDKLRAVLEAVEPDITRMAYQEVADMCYAFENITGCPALITQRDILDRVKRFSPAEGA